MGHISRLRIAQYTENQEGEVSEEEIVEYRHLPSTQAAFKPVMAVTEVTIVHHARLRLLLIPFVAMLLLLQPFGVNSFLAPCLGQHHQQQPLSVSLVSSKTSTTSSSSMHVPTRLLVRDDKNKGGDPWALNKARTDVRNFLTQRALQSFLFLLMNCRDQATVQWFEVSIKVIIASATH